MPNTALYYPWIDISQEGESWLKTSYLFWDSIRTINPEFLTKPYQLVTAQILMNEGFLEPYLVNSDMEIVNSASWEFIQNFFSNEVASMMLNSIDTNPVIHLDKLNMVQFDVMGKRLLTEMSYDFPIHHNKMNYELRQRLRKMFNSNNDNSEWLHLPSFISDSYMTFLANAISEKEGYGSLTSKTTARNLYQIAKFDAQVYFQYSFSEENVNIDYRTLATGILANMSISTPKIREDVSIKNLMKFKVRYSDELIAFRNSINELTKSINSDVEYNAMMHLIDELYNNHVKLNLRNLERALDGMNIKHTATSLFNTAFFSVGSSLLLMNSGFSTPQAILAGAGISLVYSSIRYNHEKEELLRNNPYSYLMHIQRDFR